MKLTVVHLEGSKQGLTETLTGQVITIGRDPSNVLSFDPFKDLDVSSRHASISVQGGQAILQDLGSTNGTFLNGSKVTGAIPLPAGGCMIQFGESGPKVQATWSLDEGPGKKTRMIHDLSSKLDQEEQKRKRDRRRNLIIVLLLLLLGVGVAAGLVLKARSDRIAILRKELERARERAESEQAAAKELGGPRQAKADWEAALASLNAAQEAEAREALEEARDAYEQAVVRFQKAGRTANAAALEKLKEQLAQASKQADQSLADKEAKDRADRAKLEEQNKALLAALRKELEAARKVQDLLRALDRVDRNNPEQLKQAIATVEKALGELPADLAERPELERRLAEFKKRLEELGNVSARLQAAAKKAKPAVVMIRSRVFALPKGQRKDTTKIRVKVAENVGTGFLASPKGRVVTAKEVVFPELFDPKAAALQAKLEERGMSFYREIEVWTLSGSEYQLAYGPDKVSIARKFDDVLGPKQKVTIAFDNSDVEVTVRTHVRGDADVVALALEGADGLPHLELGDKPVQEGLPLVALGTHKGEEGKLGLFMFEGKVSSGEKVLSLAVPSFNSWLGGPLLDADGKVVGILIQEDLEKSRGLASTAFRSALD